jgi:hypothetical protein
LIDPTLIRGVSLLLWLTGAATAAEPLPSIPPERAFKWDISRKDSVVKQEFEISSCGAYEFTIGFGGTDATNGDGSLKGKKESDQSWRRQLTTRPDGPLDGPLSKFLGDGSYSFYLKDGSDPNPIIVRTAEEVTKRNQLFRQGVYVTRLSNPGVIVPVRITLERGDSKGITDQTIDTGGWHSGGALLTRKIMDRITMKPDVYRVTAVTLRDSPLPEGITTYLLISPIAVTPSKYCD